MSVRQVTNFLRVPNAIYRTLGIQDFTFTETTFRRAFANTILYYVHFINMNFVWLGELAFVFWAFTTGNHFVEAIAALSYIGFVMIASFKLLIFSWRRSKLVTCLQKLEQLFPNTRHLQEEIRVDEHLTRCTKVATMFFSMYMVMIWTFNLSSMVHYLIYEVWLKMGKVGRSLPYFVYMPWDVNANYMFYLLLCSQILAGYNAAAGQAAVDLFIVGMTSQLIMHFEFLAKKIESQKWVAHNHLLVGRREEEFIREIVIYHEMLFRIVDEINNVFDLALLFNFLSSAGVICFLGFQITIGVSFQVLFKNMLGFLATSAQVLLICQYGQMLAEASTKVSAATFNHDWTMRSVSFQKMLMMMSMRSQRPAYLMATTFAKVSLGTMTQIMQVSYKFLTVLRAIYSD